VNDSLETWFKREILSQEGALLRYLSRVWPRRDDITDLRQETYARVFEAAGASRPAQPRAFLFATARNLMSDRIRRERVVSIEAVGNIDELNVLVEEVTPERSNIARQELKRLASAFDLLPPKCREVMWLRRVQEMSQREVASELRIKETTVEKHVSKAIRLLAKYMLAGDLPGEQAPKSEIAEDENEHGMHK
jgi:RNA polymerase sigma factor (sigma-70 family)